MPTTDSRLSGFPRASGATHYCRQRWPNATRYYGDYLFPNRAAGSQPVRMHCLAPDAAHILRTRVSVPSVGGPLVGETLTFLALISRLATLRRSAKRLLSPFEPLLDIHLAIEAWVALHRQALLAARGILPLRCMYSTLSLACHPQNLKNACSLFQIPQYQHQQAQRRSNPKRQCMSESTCGRPCRSTTVVIGGSPGSLCLLHTCPPHPSLCDVPESRGRGPRHPSSEASLRLRGVHTGSLGS